MTRNAADAEDVRQEAFLKAMSRLAQFSGIGIQDGEQDDLRAWVSRIAANASIDLIRKRRDGKLFSLEEPNGAGEETLGSHVASCADNPEERFARREMRKLMADAIAQLAPELRQVCLLRDVLQYSTQEVADRLKQRPVRAARMIPTTRRRVEGSRIPLASFAECACGD